MAVLIRPLLRCKGAIVPRPAIIADTGRIAGVPEQLLWGVQVAEHFDVMIVGGGLIGASLACALADSGLRLALLDRQLPVTAASLEDTAFDPRVSAITPASQAFFERLGLWSAMAGRRVSPYLHMHVWEADGTASIDFSATEVHAPALGHIVENSVMVASLHEALAGLEAVTVLAPAVVQEMQQLDGLMQLQLEDGRCLQAPLVVGADGARSRVRELAGLAVRDWDYGHHALVTTVQTALPHQQTAWQRFMDDGVLAFLPLQGPADARAQRFSSIVWSATPALNQALLAADEAQFAAQLGAAIEHRLGEVLGVARRCSFPLRQAHARDYVCDGVALVGDAAHSIHPLAGQGANLGLADVQALAEVLREARRHGLDWHRSAVLRRYQRRRQGHNLSMMALMEGFRHLYADQPLPLRWLRNSGMRFVDSNAAIKRSLIRQAMG